MAASKLPTYYGSGRSTSHLVGVLTKGGALKAGKQFLTSDLKEAGFSVGVFESPDGYYVINIGKTMKKNPTTRTQRAAVGYVNRPSQITKKAPTKRLKKRRTINLQTPRGVFPNPSPRVYRGKYPTRIREVSAPYAGKKGHALVVLNNGEKHVVKAVETGGVFPKVGSEFDSIFVNRNPSSVHFDIDVNSHNARGSKAKTRTNPVARKKEIIVEYELSGQNFAKRNRGMYGWKELAKFPDTPEGSENAIQYAEAYHKIAPHLRIQVVTK